MLVSLSTRSHLFTTTTSPFPFLTANIAVSKLDYIYEQGELALFGGAAMEFYKDETGTDAWTNRPPSGLILDSRVVMGQVWRNRLFLQDLPGGRDR